MRNIILGVNASNKTIDLFLSNLPNDLDPDKCWDWQGGFFVDKPYGRLCASMGSMGKFTHRAHQFSFWFFNGDIPEDKVVMHKCDRGQCVNPQHLQLGTNLDNTRDMIQKGRAGWKYGAESSGALLTDVDSREIHNLIRSTDEPFASIARRYKISRITINNLAHGKTWTHLPPFDQEFLRLRGLRANKAARNHIFT